MTDENSVMDRLAASTKSGEIVAERATGLRCFVIHDVVHSFFVITIPDRIVMRRRLKKLSG